MEAHGHAGATAHTLYDRTLPTSGDTGGGDAYDSFNLIFIVAFAVLIAFIAQWINRRGGRKK